MALIEAKANIDNRLLMEAISFKNYDIASVLINAKADVNCIGEDGETCLTRAIYNDCDGAVSILLDAKADIDVKNRSGKSALMVAIYQKKCDDILPMLLDAKADVSALMPDTGKTVMETLLSNLHTDKTFMEILLSKLQIAKSRNGTNYAKRILRLIDAGASSDAIAASCSVLLENCIDHNDLTSMRALLNIMTPTPNTPS